MSLQQFEIVTVKGGVKSLRLIENLEIFHPGIGPVAEATLLHVQQHQLEKKVRALTPVDRFVIWDVGLGAAANALAAIESVISVVARNQLRGKVELHSFDQTTAPLLFALEHSKELGYLDQHRGLILELLERGQVQVCEGFTWVLHLGDFRNFVDQRSQSFLGGGSFQVSPQAVFYDPYSPHSNREMWSLEHLAQFRRCFKDTEGCLITNYSRSTAVRVTWLLAGFYVGIGCSIGEKAETTLVSNTLHSLETPLSCEWLDRVKRSRCAAPLAVGAPLGPIGDEDFEKLLEHPQFRR